jgi:hypothetical protein
MHMFRVAPLLILTLALACNTPASTPTQVPESPTTTTEFHISVMNACMEDVTLVLADGPGQPGRKQVLLQNQRDTVSGTREQVYLVGRDGEMLASYRPVQGKQRLTISSDCSAMTPDE